MNHKKYLLRQSNISYQKARHNQKNILIDAAKYNIKVENIETIEQIVNNFFHTSKITIVPKTRTD